MDGAEHLSEAVARAQLDWPGVVVDAAALRGLLERVAPAALRSAAACAQVAFADLYASCACLGGDARALELFRSRVTTWVGTAVARLGLGTSERGEVEALVLDGLLMAEPPKLAQYDGRTALRRWIAVIAVRTGLNLRRDRRREVPLSDSVLLERATADDPRLAYFRELYAAELKVAFAAALASLSARRRNLLRSQAIDGLTLQQIGLLYGLHASTVSRELALARTELERQTRGELAAQLALPIDEVDSIIALVRSHLENSLQRLLVG